MKLLSSNTASKLERAQAEREKAVTTLADLRAQRDGLDVEQDDYASVSLTLEGQIRVHQAAIEASDRRIAGLTAKVEAEAVAAAAARRAQAIREAETKALPARMAAIEALAQWARDGVTLVEKLESASRLKGWPSDLEAPYVDDVRPDRMMRAIAAAFRGLGADWHPAGALEIIDDAVANEAAHHRQAIAELKRQPELESEAA